MPTDGQLSQVLFGLYRFRHALMINLAMIKELSEDGQFIITTFRPELLSHADNFLGVIFDARKVSTIKQITQEECYSFVEANEKTT